MGKRRLARVRSGHYDVEAPIPIVDVVEDSNCPFDGQPCAYVDCCDALIGFECDCPRSR